MGRTYIHYTRTVGHYRPASMMMHVDRNDENENIADGSVRRMDGNGLANGQNISAKPEK